MLSTIHAAEGVRRAELYKEGVSALQQHVRQTGTMPTLTAEMDDGRLALLSNLLDTAVSRQELPDEPGMALHFGLVPVVLGLPEAPVQPRLYLPLGMQSLALMRLGGLLQTALGIQPGTGWVQCVPEIFHRSVVAGATLSDILAYPERVRAQVQGKAGRVPELTRTHAMQDSVQANADIFYMPVVWKGPTALPANWEAAAGEFVQALGRLIQEQLFAQGVRLLGLIAPVPYGAALSAGESMEVKYYARRGIKDLLRQSELPAAALTATLTAYTINNQADSDAYIVGVTYQGVLDAQVVGATVITPSMCRISPEEALRAAQSALQSMGLHSIKVTATVERTDLCLSCGMPHLVVPMQAIPSSAVFH